MNRFRSPARVGRVLLLSAVVALGGCSAMQAQNPSSALQPVNAVKVDDARLMLFGHDVVAYFTEGRHALGSAEFQSVHEGVTFRFANARHKAMFDAEPMKYVPQYGGFCADGIVYAIPWGGDPDTWMIRDGRLFIFGGAASRDAFLLDVPGNIALADKYWADEVQGSHSFWQRSKRLVWRVPHYKSGGELAELVRQARAAKGS
ncbi:YHS domain-containing (seleno)protein [Piscinibacter sakaiensis]|uniref:YHS domain-containing (seleno)protein n=1 Tax=Piscinibacter sakaiensis TaxID=1547922 RepID=UPI003AAD104F